jgi:hypothetical protein
LQSYFCSWWMKLLILDCGWKILFSSNYDQSIPYVYCVFLRSSKWIGWRKADQTALLFQRLGFYVYFEHMHILQWKSKTLWNPANFVKNACDTREQIPLLLCVNPRNNVNKLMVRLSWGNLGDRVLMGHQIWHKFSVE